MKDAKIIGITGGVGCGKSTVIDFLHNEYDAVIYKADSIGHEVIKQGTEGYKKVVARFGQSILSHNGEIDRRILSNIVFKNQDELNFLNSVIHPAVKEYILNDIESNYINNKRLFFVEAALLIESGYKAFCDELWYVYATDDVRIKRLMDSRGYTKDKCLSIMSNQLNDEEFRKNCNLIIDNSYSFEETKIQIEKHMKIWYNK